MWTPTTTSGGQAATAPLSAVDIAIDQRVGIAAARASTLSRIAGSHKQRDGDLVELDVAAAGRDQLGDLLREDRDQIGEERIDIRVGPRSAKSEKRRKCMVDGAGSVILGVTRGGIAQEHELVERERLRCAGAGRWRRAR